MPAPLAEPDKAMNHTFKKEERLCNKALIAALYQSGSSFLCYPFRVTWLLDKKLPDVPAQVLITAPKKRFKHATDRNLLKRRTREAYRTHKSQHLYSQLLHLNQSLIFSVTYIGKEIAAYNFIQKKMLKLLNQLAEEVKVCVQ